jgi:CAI-1 autoinducer synthase
MQAIADENTNVYIDFFTHMSLWEGIKSCGAKPFAFKHNDVAHLEKLIKKNGPGIILVDSVYSTMGSISPLKEIADISSQYGCAFVVDESHSLGTHGPKGAGLVAELDIRDKVHFITASLAKAFAGRAGIIICSEAVAKSFPYIAHPAIFSSVLLAHEIAGLSATLELIIQADDKRKQLHQKSRYFRDSLSSLGYNLDSVSQIIGLEAGTETETELLRDALEERNVFGSVFCTPATPKNRSLMRFSLNSDLTYEQLNYIIKACDEIRDEVGMWEWRSTKRKPKQVPTPA